MKKPQKENQSSLQRFKATGNVDRRFLWQYVARKLKNTIPVAHVSSVVSILLEEMATELVTNGSIRIGNFGKFFFSTIIPHNRYNFHKFEKVMSKEHNILRFKLKKIVKIFLVKKLDLVETFKETDNVEEGT